MALHSVVYIEHVNMNIFLVKRMKRINLQTHVIIVCDLCSVTGLGSSGTSCLPTALDQCMFHTPYVDLQLWRELV